VTTPEAQVNAHLREKRETAPGGVPGAAPALPAQDVPSHGKALGMGRESYPAGQRGDEG
jgi:hypothetical protein